MAEPTEFEFSHRDVAEALIKAQGIHEGKWMLVAKFGFGAGNIGNSPDASVLNPSAIVSLLSLGIKKTDETNSLTVDAAEVNPKTVMAE